MVVKRLKIGFVLVSARNIAQELKSVFFSFADDESGLTWGGQTYETPDARPSGNVVTETKAVADGIDIAETEVILVTFK
jgi:hypothetical protein